MSILTQQACSTRTGRPPAPSASFLSYVAQALVELSCLDYFSWRWFRRGKSETSIGTENDTAAELAIRILPEAVDTT